MAASAGDDEREPLIPIVVLRRTLGDRVVVRVERQEGYADRVELCGVDQEGREPAEHCRFGEAMLVVELQRHRRRKTPQRPHRTDLFPLPHFR